MPDYYTKQYAIHLGKKSKKRIRQFSRGVVGEMNIEIQQVLQQLQSQMKEKKELIPIVIVHRRKKKKKRRKKKQEKVFRGISFPGGIPLKWP